MRPVHWSVSSGGWKALCGLNRDSGIFHVTKVIGRVSCPECLALLQSESPPTLRSKSGQGVQVRDKITVSFVGPCPYCDSLHDSPELQASLRQLAADLIARELAAESGRTLRELAVIPEGKP